MTRPSSLANSSTVAAMLAAALATGSIQAQHPTLTVAQSATAPTITFDLGTSTGAGNTHVMLACYVDIVGNMAGLSKLIKKSVGAVASYASPNTTTTPFIIPGVDTSIANVPNAGVPSDEIYTVPPSIIANAIAEMNWGVPTNTAPFFSYAKPLATTMAWSTTGLTAAPSAFPWGECAYESSTVAFDVETLIRSCIARQIGYTSGLGPIHETVLTQVEAIVSACRGDAQTLALNTVAIELTNGTPGNRPTPIRIRLSRKSRITLQIPGAGGNANGLHYNFVWPVHSGSNVKVLLAGSGVPLAGLNQLFVPTISGFQAVDAEIHSAINPQTNLLESWLEAPMPVDVISGPFAAFNTAELQYLLMEGLNGATLSNWLWYTPYSMMFSAFPLVPMQFN